MDMRPIFTALFALTCMTAAAAQEPPRAAGVAHKLLKPNVVVLRSEGGTQVAGNVLAVIGDKGVLLVDSGYPQFVPWYRTVLDMLHGGPVTHVGLYVGQSWFIHSATKGVQISTLSAVDPYGRWWYRRWVGVRRVIPQGSP